MEQHMILLLHLIKPTPVLTAELARRVTLRRKHLGIVQQMAYTDARYQLPNLTWLESEAKNIGKSELLIQDMHNIVEHALEEVNRRVCESYRNYRNYKQDFVRMLDKVYQESQKIMYIGDKENSNSDSALVSTKRSLIFNQLNKELYKKFFLTLSF